MTLSKIWNWFWSQFPATKHDLKKLGELIRMTNAELLAKIDALTAQENKIAKEQSDRFDVLTAKIKELTDALNNAGSVPPEVEAALTALQAATQALDDTIPDAPAMPF